MTRPTIAFTVSGRRPGYLREVLDAWARVRGLDAWAVGFLVEPGPELEACCTVIDAFAAGRGAGAATTTVVNPRPLGVLANPHRALSWAFEEQGAPFAVLAEEDVVVGDDVVEFLDAQRAALGTDPSVLAVCAHSLLPAPQPVDVVADGPFDPWVWATWADRWHDLFAGRWFSAAVGPAPHVEEGFDFGIERLLASEGRRVVVPLASRSDNIGEHGGVHALPADFADSRASTFLAHREPVAWATRTAGTRPAAFRPAGTQSDAYP